MKSTKDTVRQFAVALSAVVAIVGSFIGSGAAGGTPIQDAAGGTLGAAATPIAPAVPAFSIWSIIYLGLVAYAIWQFLPKQKAAPRQRRLGYWIAASLLLNAAWILSIQFDLLALSVPVIVALLAVLVIAFRICVGWQPSGAVEAVVVDGTVGLYLGWVCVATAANFAALFTAAGFRGFGIDADVWAVIVVALAGLVGVAVAVGGHGRIAPALSLAWGLSWLAVARLTGELHSTPAGVAALVAVAAVIVATVASRIVAPRGVTA